MAAFGAEAPPNCTEACPAAECIRSASGSAVQIPPTIREYGGPLAGRLASSWVSQLLTLLAQVTSSTQKNGVTLVQRAPAGIRICTHPRACWTVLNILMLNLLTLYPFCVHTCCCT